MNTSIVSAQSEIPVGKLPNLSIWFSMAIAGLLIVIGALGWNWEVTSSQSIQKAGQQDVSTQVEAIRGWLNDLNSPNAANSTIALSTISQRLQQDAKSIGGDSGTKVQQLAMMVQGWVSHEKEVGDAHTAKNQMFSQWQQLRKANAALDSQTGLSTGVWAEALTPVRTEIAQIDPQALSSVFEAQPALGALQKQWSDRLVQYAGNAQQLANKASQDTGLNSSDRQAIRDWAQPLQAAADASRTLAESLSARIDAQTWPDAFTGLANQINLAMFSLSGDKDIQHTQWAMGVGALLLLIASLGLGFGLRKQRGMLLEQIREHQTSMASRRSLDRLTRQMRQVLRPDMAGEPSRARLEEPSRNPGYNLATLVNQVLDVREGVLTQIAENEDKVNRIVQGLRRQVKEFEQASRDRQSRADQSAQHHLLQAQGLAALGQQVRRCVDQAGAIWSGFRNSQTAVQETTWKTEAIRSKSQGAAKRIKRVGESTQSISVSMDVIRQQGARIQLLSFNAAIEAPLAGGTGRNLAVLVSEIQKLAQSTDQTVKETEIVVRDIQEDAKQAVSTMEQNTEDVVDANKRATQAGSTLQNIEKQSEGMVAILNKLVEAIELRAIEDADLAEADKRDRAAADRMIEQSSTIHEAFDTLLQSGQAGALAVRQRLNRLPSS